MEAGTARTNASTSAANRSRSHRTLESPRVIASFGASVALGLLSLPLVASPLPVRDQNPLLAGFDLPGALPATLSEHAGWAFESSFLWGNSAIVQANPREALIVDAETRELRLTLRRSFAKGYGLQLELPIREVTAGTLDSFIDGWHDFFGLPEGARPALPRDQLHVFYQRDGFTRLDARSSRSGIGDVSLRLGKQFGERPIAAWVSLKLPTGDGDDFTGSGSVDASVALAATHAFGDRYGVFGQLAGVWLGNADRLRDQQEDVAWSALVGISARATENLTLTAQVDAHSALYRSDEHFLGDAVLLTLGGSYRVTRHWDAGFAVTEDIAVESAPDVTFVFQVQRRW